MGRLVAAALWADEARQKGRDRLRGGADDPLTFYWRADDAFSHIVAQLVATLAERFDLAVDVITVPASAADVDPEPELRARYAIADAQALADAYGLSFPRGEVSLPSRDRIRLANAIGLAARGKEAGLAAILEAGEALWRGEGKALTRIAKSLGAEAGGGIDVTLDANYASLRKRGHYHAATVHFAGSWYEGPFRMVNLAERLARRKGREVEAPLRLRGALTTTPQPVEMFFSFRSPYSYLALYQLEPYVRREGAAALDLRVRPVLPMVMRGLEVPRSKKLTLLRDSAREARRLGIPFGQIADPVGIGAERCVAVYRAAYQLDTQDGGRRAFDFAYAAACGIWSAALTPSTDAGIAKAAEAAGLDAEWALAAAHDLESAREFAEANRRALLAAGVWGVPSFRVGETVLWGQDRLPLVLHHAGAQRV